MTIKTPMATNTPATAPVWEKNPELSADRLLLFPEAEDAIGPPVATVLVIVTYAPFDSATVLYAVTMR